MSGTRRMGVTNRGESNRSDDRLRHHPNLSELVIADRSRDGEAAAVHEYTREDACGLAVVSRHRHEAARVLEEGRRRKRTKEGDDRWGALEGDCAHVDALTCIYADGPTQVRTHSPLALSFSLSLPLPPSLPPFLPPYLPPSLPPSSSSLPPSFAPQSVSSPQDRPASDPSSARTPPTRRRPLREHAGLARGRS